MTKKIWLAATFVLVGGLSSCTSEVVDGTRASLVDVTWTNVVGVTVTGNSIQKIGANGWDAGAISVETLSGDGYIEFTTGEGHRNKMVGLSDGDTDQHYNDIDFAFYLRKGHRISVYEGGTNRGEFGTYNPGDTFRIEALAGTIRYVHNGTLLYTSSGIPTFPLNVDTSLFNSQATVLNVQIDSSIWTNVVGATATDDDIIKTGATGAWDAGASTLSALATDGYVEFTTGERNTNKFAGLTSSDDDQSFADIDYAFYLRKGGGLEIYEAGVRIGAFGTYETGDVFRVEVIGGQVRYYQDAALLHTSTVSATLPLVADASLYTNGATVLDVTIREDFWTNDVNVDVLGGNLEKTGATGWDGGAVSIGSLVGDGTLTFTTGETNRYKMIGLSNGDTDQHYDDIDYAFYLRKGGRVDVYEAGVREGTAVGTYSSGDTFRISVTGTTVEYAIEGAVVYTSTAIPTFPLIVDTSFYNTGATVRDVVLTSLGPPNPIDDLSGVLFDRRTGEVDFTWTAVADNSGSALDSYELRCAQSPIVDESDWAAARVAGGTLPTPGSSGTVESARMNGFLVGSTVHCVMRGLDLGGRATPIPGANETVANDFLQQDVTAAGSTALGWTISGIGDVNGDGVDDVALGSTGGNVWLYFGSPSGLSSTPDVTIVGPGSGSGRVITGLGDFNGDTYPDFALSARAISSLAGEVYIMYGRPLASPWPSTIDLTTGGCQADVCLTGGEPGAILGWSVRSAGDFDGDGSYDVAIGALRSDTEGAVYVILGGNYASNTQFDVPAAMPALEPDGFVFAAPATWLNLGADSASVGDLTGDGRDELFISATGSSSSGELGRVASIDGRAYPMAGVGLQAITTGEVTTLATGDAGFFGEKITGGDFDGDGNTDLAVHESRGTGFIYVYRNFGGATGFDGTRWVITNSIPDAGGDRIGDTLGEAWHPALGVRGDLDVNGAVDVLGGSHERGTGIGTADIWYFKEAAGMPVNRIRADADAVLSPATIVTMGRRTAAYIGDVDGDGYADVAVGDETNNSGAGLVSIYY